MASRLQRLCGSLKRLLIEVGEQDCFPGTLPARDRLPNPPDPDDDQYLSIH